MLNLKKWQKTIRNRPGKTNNTPFLIEFEDLTLFLLYMSDNLKSYRRKQWYLFIVVVHFPYKMKKNTDN